MSRESVSQNQLQPNVDYGLKNFLADLWRGGQYAYYWTPTEAGDGSGISFWFDTSSIPEPPSDWDHVYFGVHPLWQRGTEHQRGGNDAARVSSANCLFADLDAKLADGGQAAILDHLDSLWRVGVPYPTALIDSGGGYHAYWIFDDGQTQDLRDESTKRRHDALQRTWVKYVVGGTPGLDGSVKDLNRVLRCPGTFNHKYDPVRPVAMVEYHRYRVYNYESLANLARSAYKAFHKRTQKVSVPRAVSAGNAGNWDRLYNWKIEDAMKAGAVRHSELLNLAHRLNEEGCPEGTALQYCESFVAQVITDRNTANESRNAIRHAYR